MTGWLVAQVGGTDGLSAVLTTVGQYGIAAVFIFLYFQERKERQAAQATLAAFVDKHAGLLRDTADALKEAEKGMAAQVERAGASPLRYDLDISLRRLELAADELAAQARRRESQGA